MALNSFPHYLQLDSMDCGPACLKMIAKYYGKTYSLENLRERCFITREGVSLLGISDAAESIGMRTIGVKTSFENLAKDGRLPCILHWNQNHFVVCYKIKTRRNGEAKIYIADPASRNVVYNKDEFLKCWTAGNASQVGIALMLHPGVDFQDIEEAQHQERLDVLCPLSASV